MYTHVPYVHAIYILTCKAQAALVRCEAWAAIVDSTKSRSLTYVP